MTADDLLKRAGLDSPKLRVLIHPIAPERIGVRPAPMIMRRLWGNGIQAMTIRGTIYVDPSFLAGHERPLGLLVVHELAHARQWVDLGVLSFLKRYISGYLKGRMSGLGHRDAYKELDLEAEARDLVDRIR